MSKQEYRNDLHKILDLVMDVQEKKGPVASFELRPSTNDVVVAVFSRDRKLNEMFFTNYRWVEEMDTTEEIIKALESAKMESKV